MTYFFDGSKNGFLTAFLRAFSDEEAILTSQNAQLSLGQESEFVAADEALAGKAERRLKEYDKECMNELDLLLRSGESDRDMVAFRYLKKIARGKRPVRSMLADDDVLAATEHMRRVTFEIHRMHGFLRFMESASGALYAPFAPDNDICDLVAPHFQRRLPDFPFVIHDVKRKKAAVYDGKTLFLAPLDKTDVLLSADEIGWQSLWKRYYASVNIPSRERLKQMRGYMPVRYWKYISEKISPDLK